MADGIVHQSQGVFYYKSEEEVNQWLRIDYAVEFFISHVMIFNHIPEGWYYIGVLDTIYMG